MNASELVVSEQMHDLKEIALARDWPLSEIEPGLFTIGLPARDQKWYSLLVDCRQFPELPPAFNWRNSESGQLNALRDTPKGSGYFHREGRICAPWNRTAYKEVDSQGAHNDWQLAGWMANSRTGGTTTLAAMILRVHQELQSNSYSGPLA